MGTMYYSFCLLVSTLGVALSHPSIPTTTQETKTSLQDFSFDHSCVFGNPTVSCEARCSLMSWEPYCVYTQCLCRPSRTHQGDYEPQNVLHQVPVDPPTTANPSASSLSDTETTDDEEPGKFRSPWFWWIFIPNVSSFFGRNVNVSSTAEPATPSTPLLTVHEKDSVEKVKVPSVDLVVADWSFQHYLAVLIVVLLSVLILLEVSFCMKRRQWRNSTDNIFKNAPVPNK